MVTDYAYLLPLKVRLEYPVRGIIVFHWYKNY